MMHFVQDEFVRSLGNYAPVNLGRVLCHGCRPYQRTVTH